MISRDGMYIMKRQNAYIDIMVKLNCPEFKIESKDGIIKVSVTERPKDNKANIEIIKRFEKKLGTNVAIARGAKSRRKTLKIEDSTEDGVRQALGL